MKHTRSTTHQGTGILIAYALGNLEEESLAPNGVAGERALVQIGCSVHLALFAHCLPAGQALLAMTTACIPGILTI